VAAICPRCDLQLQKIYLKIAGVARGFWEGKSGSGYWMLDAGYWMLDAGYWILDAGYWILDAGYWMLGKLRKGLAF
jgi:hypothetical protein